MSKAEQQEPTQSIISNATESDKVKISTFTDNGTTHIFRRYKEENGKMLHKQVTTDNMNTMSAEDLDVSGKSLGTYAPIIVRSDVIRDPVDKSLQRIVNRLTNDNWSMP
jgi:hypothetical protein